jgi:hypothetical protein
MEPISDKTLASLPQVTALAAAIGAPYMFARGQFPNLVSTESREIMRAQINCLNAFMYVSMALVSSKNEIYIK